MLDRLAIALGCRPRSMEITDQQTMLALMQQNIALNGLDGAVHASVYNWGSPRTGQSPEHPDVGCKDVAMPLIGSVADR